MVGYEDLSAQEIGAVKMLHEILCAEFGGAEAVPEHRVIEVYKSNGMNSDVAFAELEEELKLATWATTKAVKKKKPEQAKPAFQANTGMPGVPAGRGIVRGGTRGGFSGGMPRDARAPEVVVNRDGQAEQRRQPPRPQQGDQRGGQAVRGGRAPPMNMPGGGRPMMNMPAPADKPLSAPSNHDLQQGMLPVPTVANGEPIVRQDAPVPSTNQWYNGPPRPQEEMLPPMIQQAPPQQKMPSPPQQQIPSQQMPQQMQQQQAAQQQQAQQQQQQQAQQQAIQQQQLQQQQALQQQALNLHPKPYTLNPAP
ncbi:hypothetical protein T484DRAFT_2113862 [Baffinella frigidus]|nr:hypothetical protein T484DRAFT_2113862 [Cryptophyta sp. CCMP2293]